MRLGKVSRERLEGVHPDLVKVVKQAIEITPLDFGVVEGVRTVRQQKVNVAKGASQTMKSRHIPECNECLMGCAVDIAPIIQGKFRWDWPLFHILADTMKKAAITVEVPIEWGGDWKRFKDGPHFQLPWKEYP